MEVVVLSKQDLANLVKQVVESCRDIQPPPAPPRIVTGKELCEILKICENSLIAYRTRKKIPFLMVGDSIRYEVNAVLRAIEAKK